MSLAPYFRLLDAMDELDHHRSLQERHEEAQRRVYWLDQRAQSTPITLSRQRWAALHRLLCKRQVELMEIQRELPREPNEQDEWRRDDYACRLRDIRREEC